MAFMGLGQMMPQQVSPETQRIFYQVDRDRSGSINAMELKQALMTSNGRQYSDEACKLMISMFDDDRSGTIDVFEFERLCTFVNAWVNSFNSYDRDRSGTMEEGELTQALIQLGFRFNYQLVRSIMNDSQNRRAIAIDQFIVLCVKLQRLTNAFNGRDIMRTGTISISLEDFLNLALDI